MVRTTMQSARRSQVDLSTLFVHKTPNFMHELAPPRVPPVDTLWTSWRSTDLRSADLRSAAPAVQAKATGEQASERTPVRERVADPVNARMSRQGGQPSIEASNDTDELPLNADVVVKLGGIIRIRRLKADPVLLLEEPLQRDRVLLDLGDDDVPVASG